MIDGFKDDIALSIKPEKYKVRKSILPEFTDMEISLSMISGKRVNI